jgi:hypothetical protein
MNFDLERFRAASLAPRQAQIPVPDLAHFFAAGTEPLWTVRGLTGEEIARANDATQRGLTIGNAVEALAAAANKGDQVDALKTLIGYGSEVPADLAKRLDHLCVGSIDPVIDRETAVRLFNNFPIVAYQLTNEILRLTGLGADVGKLPHSMQTPASSTL